MPGLKRNGGNGSGTSGQNNKRPRHDESVKSTTPSTSVLRSEEIDFPRGGGSKLTQFEHKQALREVDQEAREKRAAKKALQTSTPTADDELFKDRKIEQKRKANREKKNAERKKRTVDTTKKSKGKTDDTETTAEEKLARVELLNYKRLTVGTRLLCSVLAVHPLAIVVSLPDQLLGHIPITNISETFTQRLEGMADSDEEDDEDESDDDEEKDVSKKSGVPELRDMFSVGQWIHASVAALQAPGTTKQTRGREGGEYEQESQRVELTLDPTVVNEGVSVSDLSTGFTLPLSVKSKEDHGYLMNTGIEGVSAFISFKDAGKKVLEEGQVVQAFVSALADNQRSFSATINNPKYTSTAITVPPSARALLPGNLLQVLVTATSNQGINVKAFGMFDATISSLHMEHDEDYQVGQKIKARILWEQGPELDDVRDDVASRKIAMSAAPSVLSLSSRSTIPEKYPIGARVQATVLSTIEDWGLMCVIKGEDETKAFTHISACSDDHVVSLPATTGRFKIGTSHAARVVGHSLTDEIVRLSFQQSILDRAFMRVSEVMVGEAIKATIRVVNPKAIVLNINGSVDGVVFPAHFAEVPLKKPEKKYKVGQSVSARVLKVDPEQNRIVLTLKRTLVQSTLSTVANMQDARVGVITHGTIGRIIEGNVGPSALLVDLFGQIRAYVPINEALENSSKMSAESIRSSFFVGQCVKVRLTRVDYESGRVSGSIRQASESYLKRLNVDVVNVGDSVDGKLAAVHQDVVVLELQPSNVRALLGLNTLAKMRSLDVESLRQQLTEGELINDLKVLDKKADRGIVIVGSQNSLPSVQDADLSVGKVVTARVYGRDGNAALLNVGKNVRCRLHAVDRADDYGSSDQNADTLLPAKDETIQVKLLNLKGITNKRAEVSTRPSVLQGDGDSSADIRDPIINKANELQVGQKVRGFVKSAVEKAGVFVDVGRNVTARVKISELSDSFIADWKNHFKTGQLVEGTITDVDSASNKVEMSLKSKAGVTKTKKESAKSVDATMLASLEVGQKIKGFVRALAEFGVFVQIEGTTLSGLAHKTQLSDDADPDQAVKAFSVGDKVKAVILKLDAEKKKLSFGLKPSLFSSEDFEESEDEEDEEEDGDGSEAGSSDVEMDADALLQDDSDNEDMLEIDHGSDSDAEEDDDSEEDSEVDIDDLEADLESGDEDEAMEENDEESDDDDHIDIDAEIQALAKEDGDQWLDFDPNKISDDEDSSDDDDEDEEEDSDEEAIDLEEDETAVEASKKTNQKKSAVAPALHLSGGFSWSADGIKNGNEDSSDNSDSSDDENEDSNKRSRKRGKKAMQEDLTADLATKMPESAQDFERLLLGSPNSSFLWIQFVSFQVQLGDVEKAREIAKRALQTIHFREEQEKFNVWLALLNLENTYGSAETLESTFKEACQYNEPKAVHLRLADILEQSGKLEAAQDHWKRTAKKFGLSSKVWQGYHRFLLRNGAQGSHSDDSRAVVSRSMQSLDKRKHVKTILAYALDEFRIGDSERGRTIFEGLVDSYPKRLDIWWQYIDQETKGQNTSQVRDLFERILALKLSSKKIKSVLKKWLEFEKRHGDQAGQQAVLAHARRIVEEQKKKSENNDEEDEEMNSDEEED
ncbi:uncharacterized protein FA14DRAFT_84513 [Meira miltonrushii]|uniref:S1 motif domain-containing protein n=1 Tax=Meira miltonrushii TaxID=1280837 RepID=A0A316V4W0_9BASI|nr:uncharacterized protein FA14DRAFT_84513 [Meira miltonrushii]PWN32058.1 hypothetical protein FA14DRAFT_84513 [Meira miltonrushii]